METNIDAGDAIISDNNVFIVRQFLENKNSNYEFKRSFFFIFFSTATKKKRIDVNSLNTNLKSEKRTLFFFFPFFFNVFREIIVSSYTIFKNVFSTFYSSKKIY